MQLQGPMVRAIGMQVKDVRTYEDYVQCKNHKLDESCQFPHRPNVHKLQEVPAQE